MHNLILIILLLNSFFSVANDQSKDAHTELHNLWNMNLASDLETFGNDRTGAEFEFSDAHYITASSSLKIIPSGSADDTKLSIPLSGERLGRWIGHEKMQFHIYLPEANRVNPSNFFLGMANVTSGSWSWVHGLHWNESDLAYGWNQITFSLPETMSMLDQSGEYTLFIFFTAFMPPREDNVKLPLHEYFFIDAITVI